MSVVRFRPEPPSKSLTGTANPAIFLVAGFFVGLYDVTADVRAFLEFAAFEGVAYTLFEGAETSARVPYTGSVGFGTAPGLAPSSCPPAPAPAAPGPHRRSVIWSGRIGRIDVPWLRLEPSPKSGAARPFGCAGSWLSPCWGIRLRQRQRHISHARMDSRNSGTKPWPAAYVGFWQVFSASKCRFSVRTRLRTWAVRTDQKTTVPL